MSTNFCILRERKRSSGSLFKISYQKFKLKFLLELDALDINYISFEMVDWASMFGKYFLVGSPWKSEKNTLPLSALLPLRTIAGH